MPTDLGRHFWAGTDPEAVLRQRPSCLVWGGGTPGTGVLQLGSLNSGIHIAREHIRMQTPWTPSPESASGSPMPGAESPAVPGVVPGVCEGILGPLGLSDSARGREGSRRCNGA